MNSEKLLKTIDLAWNAHLERQCKDEAEKYFGKNCWGLTISRCSEPKFKLWWEKNKEIPYDSYYYELANYIWDQSVNISQIP